MLYNGFQCTYHDVVKARLVLEMYHVHQALSMPKSSGGGGGGEECSSDLKTYMKTVQHEAANIITGATTIYRVERLVYNFNWN